ncbi:54S ribosomal protein img2, mitochondrial [Paraconiothyrium brasiliense]|uniref:Large ribosomal subunit protein mL49 n=1 Tax=Paraconiothyrium brasiliense TaxID=300254 RepID=A0ABR3REX2_9PLEO
MPRFQPLLPLLGPLAAPRRAACEQLFRFSTATRLRADLKLPPKPPQTSPEAPPSNAREASRAADLAAAEAATDADNPNAPAPKHPLPSSRSTPSSPDKTQTTDDVQPPIGDTLDAATNLKAVKPETFQAPSKAAKNSRANPSAPQKVTLELPPPKYHVARSSSRNLPIYTDYKRGGNLHLTTVRKITGDLSALRDELRVFLNKKNEDVKINSLTQHVIVKGHHVPQITEYLKARGM